MCKFSSKSGGVPFQPLGDLTWNDPILNHSSQANLDFSAEQFGPACY